MANKKISQNHLTRTRMQSVHFLEKTCFNIAFESISLIFIDHLKSQVKARRSCKVKQTLPTVKSLALEY